MIIDMDQIKYQFGFVNLKVFLRKMIYLLFIVELESINFIDFRGEK